MPDSESDPLTRLERFRSSRAYHLPATDTIRGAITEAATPSGQRFVLYLPPGYDEDGTDRTTYSVLYHLHGAGIRRRWVRKDVRWIAAAHEAAVAEGTIDPLIIVAAHDRSGFSMWCDGADGHNRQATAIIDDLLPHIDAGYRVGAGRWSRFIQGFSMGGFGALTLGLKHQDLFGAVAVWDGALHDWETLRQNRPGIATRHFGGDEQYFEAWSPWALARRADLARTPVLLFTGLLPEWAERYHRHLTALDGRVSHHAIKRLHDLRYLERSLGHHVFSALAGVESDRLP